MRSRVAVVSLLILVTALIVSTAGCSKFSRPSDAEIIKAIDDSGILKGKNFTVIPPLEIVERRDQNKDGSWTVRVKMTITMQFINGKTSEPVANDTYVRIFKAKDSAGHTVWMAKLGL
jgi:hypothetical protein